MMQIKKRVNVDFNVYLEATTWSVNIEEGIINRYDREDGKTNFRHVKDCEPLRATTGVLQVWENDHWNDCRKEIQKAYSDFLADKELLKEENNG